MLCLAYHDDRTHLGLDKQTPAKRHPHNNAGNPSPSWRFRGLGGPHHRYGLAA
jgi:hypothetical protein